MNDEPHEPVARLTINGEDHEMRRDNSSLFTHLGELAMYDHVFVQYEEGESMGAYIFRQNDVFGVLAKYMWENNYTMHLNLTDVADCDVSAFNRSLEQQTGDLDGGIPDDWN